MSDIMLMGKNPDYLGAWDLMDLPNGEIVLTIDRIEDKKVPNGRGQEELCTVCHWREKGYKPMILNVTNKKRIAKLYHTKDTEKLRGKAVQIGTEKVKAFGGVHDALRIQPVIPKQSAPAQAIKCEQCGGAIAPAYGMDAAKMAAYTKQKYGKSICAACATSAAKEAEPHE